MGNIKEFVVDVIVNFPDGNYKVEKCHWLVPSGIEDLTEILEANTEEMKDMIVDERCRAAHIQSVESYKKNCVARYRIANVVVREYKN